MDSLSWASAGIAEARKKAEGSLWQGGSRARQEMRNSGNEAKKYLKTKHITFLSAANSACFARHSAQKTA
jgi:hypothetical protein